MREMDFVSPDCVVMVNLKLDYALGVPSIDVVSQMQFKEISTGISSTITFSQTNTEIDMVRDFSSPIIIARFS